MSQSIYIDKVLDKYGLDKVKSTSTPVEEAKLSPPSLSVNLPPSFSSSETGRSGVGRPRVGRLGRLGVESLRVENLGVERPGVGRLEVTGAQLGDNDDKEGAVEDEALSFLPELGCSSAGALSCWVQLGPASKDGMAGCWK